MQVLKKGEKLGGGGRGHGRLTIRTFEGVENLFLVAIISGKMHPRGPCPYFCAGKLNAGEVALSAWREELGLGKKFLALMRLGVRGDQQGRLGT